MRLLRRPSVLLIAATFLFISDQHALAQEGTTSAIAWRREQPVRAQHAMVVSVHHLASDAGLEILRAGGNAVDAALGRTAR